MLPQPEQLEVGHELLQRFVVTKGCFDQIFKEEQAGI